MTLTLMLTASLLQPLVGLYTDRRPAPYSLVLGMGFSLVGLLLLSVAATFAVLLARGRTGGYWFGSVSSRVVARRPNGLRRTAWLRAIAVSGRREMPGPRSVRCSRRSWSSHAGSRASRGARSWRCLGSSCCGGSAAGTAISVGAVGDPLRPSAAVARHDALAPASRPVDRDPRGADLLEVLLPGQSDQLLHVLSDTKFHVSVRTAQFDLFVFLGAVAAGTILGGPIGDRLGRKYVIWGSILGVLPFTLLLPHASLFWTPVLTW